MATTQQYLNEIIKQKKALAQSLRDNGVEVSDDETFNTLVPQTGNIRPEPEEGFVIEEWTKQTNSGAKVPKIIRTIGYDVLPTYGFACIAPAFGSPTGFFGNVTEIKLNEGLTNSGRYTFYASSQIGQKNVLKTVHWPSTIEVIDQYSFYNNGSLIMDKLPDTIVKIYEYGFYNCDSITIKELPASCIQLGTCCLSGCGAITEFTIGIDIPKSCFMSDTALAKVTLTQPINIGETSFSNCSKLSEMNTEMIKSLGKNALQGTLLTDMKFNNWEGDTIGQYALANMSKLNIKTLPDTIKVIGPYAFQADTGLTQLSTSATTLSTSSTTHYCFSGCSNIVALYFASALDEGTIEKSRYLASGCTGLKYLYINMPRAEVEAMSGYSYKFVNKAAQEVTIICNDDADWITKEEFDAIDWTTK